MADAREALADIITGLKQQRDEIAVRIHLGQTELKAEWEKLQTNLDDLTREYDPVKNAASEAATNVFESLKLTASEIGDGFKKIRDAL